MLNHKFRQVFSGVILVFCVFCICLLPLTGAVLATMGLSWLGRPEQVSLLLTIFLLLSGTGFLWSYRLHRHWLPCVGGLGSLGLIYLGHEIWVNLILFYIGIAGLVGASFLDWKAR